MTGNNALGRLTRGIRSQAMKYNNNNNNNNPHTLQKEDNLIKQKHTTQETGTQNIRRQLQASIPNKKAEELKKIPTHGQFYRDL
jgi:hypothetical protein